MGPVAKEFVPALKAMYARQDSGDQRKTLEALSKIDPTAVTRISAWNKWWPVVLATMIFCGLTVIAAILPAVITWWRGPRTEQPPSPKSAV
jgi:hypothetical protein